jgi:hypothetical protein
MTTMANNNDLQPLLDLPSGEDVYIYSFPDTRKICTTDDLANLLRIAEAAERLIQAKTFNPEWASSWDDLEAALEAFDALR